MITILFFLMLRINAFCPEINVFYILKAKEINYYDKLIQAVVMVESMNGKYIYNAKEDAVGWFQIRQVRIDNYNELTSSCYTLKDCYDYELSRKIFLFYAHGKSYNQAARDWNGSGRQTLTYWGKVKTLL